MRLGDYVREDLSQISSSRILTDTSTSARPAWVPLEAIADVRFQPQVATIARRNGERCNTIQAFVSAEALPPEVTANFLNRLQESDVALPPGYRIQIGGDSEELANSISSLFAYAPVLGLLIAATLVFPSVRSRWQA